MIRIENPVIGITDKMAQRLLALTHDGFRNIILHCGCTGLGGTTIEPHVPSPHRQLDNLERLIANGFPDDRCVLRIDPIIPTDEGLNAAYQVLRNACQRFNMYRIRVRISVLDDYRHAKERFREAGLPPVYPDGQFYARLGQFDAVRQLCKKAAYRIRTWPAAAYSGRETWRRTRRTGTAACACPKKRNCWNVPGPAPTDACTATGRTKTRRPDGRPGYPLQT